MTISLKVGLRGRSGSGTNFSNGALKVAFASISAMAEIFHTIDQDVNQVT